MSQPLLNTIVTGPGDLPPLIIAHGLFGSARNWGVIAKRLSDIRQVIAVDMRNHGDSFHDPVHGYEAMAEDLGRVIEAHGGRADLLGHSMGGKAAMLLAATAPELVKDLLVADIAPVAYTHSQMEYIEAMQKVDLSGVTRRSEADPLLAEHVDDPALRAFLLQSLDVGANGVRWKLNLDALADQMPQIMGFPETKAQFDGPVHFLMGGESDYVLEEHRDRIEALLPRALFVQISGAGHWVHAEAPRAFEAAVRQILV